MHERILPEKEAKTKWINFKHNVVYLVMGKTTVYTLQDNPSTIAQDAALRYNGLTAILGGKAHLSQPLKKEADIIQITRNGVKKSALKPLSGFMGISLETLSGLLHTSLRNLQRKDDTALLDISKSEKVMELASFTQRGIDVLGSQAAFSLWLKSPLPALNHDTPLQYLDTSFGIQLLQNILGRLQHGVYS